MSGEKSWKLRAVTDIWTGDCKGKNTRLIPTGIMGSLRWWCEVLVRGLGGKACDPTDDESRCPDHGKDPLENGHHCVVCELFGCTGWARKFRLMIKDDKGSILKDSIKAETLFQLIVVEVRPMEEAEWCLLDATIRLIAKYGAIGGKTTYKPSDESGRADEKHHSDFGIIHLVENSPLKKNTTSKDMCKSNQLEEHVRLDRWKKQRSDEKYQWASLTNFWCVQGKHLARQSAKLSTFNRVMGRKEDKESAKNSPRGEIDKWLAGEAGESKKVFSFKAGEGRTFGFVNPSLDFTFIKKRLDEAWGQNQYDFKEGPQVLSDLFGQRSF